MSAIHPLSELSFAETQRAIEIVRQLHGQRDLVFKAVTLEEAPKDNVIEYLNAEQHGTPLPPIPRLAFAAYYLKGTVRSLASLLEFFRAPANLKLGQFHHNLRQSHFGSRGEDPAYESRIPWECGFQGSRAC